jgi:hypothetical protein
LQLTAKSRAYLLFGLLFVLLLGAAWYFVSDLISAGQSDTLPASPVSGRGQPEAVSGPEGLPAPSPSAKAASGVTPHETPLAQTARLSANLLGSSSKAIILQCLSGAPPFADLKADQFQTLGELLELGKAKNKETRLEYQNVHIRKTTGEHLRLRLALEPSASGGSEKMGLKLFGVDSDDLPIPAALPSELTKLSNDEAIAKFKTQGEVELDESAWSRSWDPKTSASYVIRNGQPEHLQIFSGAKMLGCDLSAESARMECVCH